MLLARMAEAVYWAGRYLERAECTARIIQVHVDTHIDLPVGEDVGWEPLLAIAGVDAAAFAERFGTGEFGTGEVGNGDGGAGGAVESGPRATHWAPSEVGRHRVPPRRSSRSGVRPCRPDGSPGEPAGRSGPAPREAWEVCNDLWLACGDDREQVRFRDGRVQWLRRVVAGCQRISGVLIGTMSRDEALSFLLIGQNLERADLTSRVLDVRADNLQPRRGDDPYEAVRWMAVLRSLAAYQPFRRAMPARPQAGRR